MTNQSRTVSRVLGGRISAMRFVVVIAMLAIWEVGARCFIAPNFLSPPSRVVLALPALFETPGVPAALWTAFWEFVVAFMLAVVIGLGAGLAIGSSRLSRLSFMPIVLFLYGLPQITILPLIILCLGIGPASKIAFGVSHGVFPIAVSVVAGMQNIKPALMVAARSMGASPVQIFRWVIFPHMIPSFFAGMRLGMAGVLLGVLLAELYVSAAGIGYFTLMFTESFDPSRLLGLIAVLAVMAIAMNIALRRAEMRFTRWQMS